MAKAKFFSITIAMTLVLSVGLAALAPGEVLAQPPYWAKTYGGENWDYAYSIQETWDGGYIVAGWTDSFGAGGYDFWVLKLDSAGNVAWQKTYGGASDDYAYSIQETQEGGYIVAGETRSFGARSRDFWVLKLDSAGNVAWQKTYGGVDADDVAFSIQQTQEGGYIVAGRTDSFGAGRDDVWVLKLDSVGNVTWQKTYGGTDDDAAFSIQQTSNGGYIVAGQTDSFGAGLLDYWVLKLDANGDVTWQKTYGGADYDYAYSIQETSDGGYIVAGSTASFGAGIYDFWVLKLGSAGNVAWQKTYGGENYDHALSIQQTSNGGYIVAGVTLSFGAGVGDAWVLKLNANGSIPDCPLGVPSDADISDTTIPAVSTEISGEDTDADIDSPEYGTLNTDCTIDTQCYYLPPPPPPVGGEVYPVSKISILAPWIGLAVLLIGGMSWLVLRWRRVHS